METKRPTKLAICGKVISIEKIGEKSLAQWKNQLKLSKVDISDAEAERVYNDVREILNRKVEQEKQ